MIAIALILNIAGFFCLAAAGSRTSAHLFDRALRPGLAGTVRWVGMTLIAASGLIASEAVGAAMTLVVLAGLSTIGAAVSVCAVTLRRPPTSR